MIISRRYFATVACAAFVGYGLRTISAWTAGNFAERLASDIARVETESGGRLGVAVLDTLTDARFGHRADERFPMCSTFKLLAAAAILARVDAKQERLDRLIEFAGADVVVNSPVTKDHVGSPGMSLEELCEAAMTMSDNTAGNLLLASLGGPEGLTAYARSLGDTVTRLDRIEPELNEATPGDVRDTTTPAAMVANMRALTLDKALSATSREQLVRWLIGNKTGDTRLRAGLPAGWRIGDKTGSGERGTTNDVGVFWPPDRAPVIVSIYLTQTAASPTQRNATLAAVGRAVASALA
jgi:beta-lactamase class A